MDTFGFWTTEPLNEIRLNIQRLKDSLFSGLSDDMTAEQKNEYMRKAWGYVEVIEKHIAGAKNIIT